MPDVDRLRHRDLHVVDVAPVPHRLEDRVGEPEEQGILRGFLTQVMIDAIHLALVEDPVHDRVEFLRRLQVVAERLFDHHPPPTVLRLIHARLRQTLDAVHVQVRADRHVIQAIGRTFLKLDQQAIQLFVIVQLAHAAAGIVQALLEDGPLGRVELVAHVIPGALFQQAPEFVVAIRMAGGADNPHVLGQAILAIQIQQRRDQLAAGQVAGCAEDNDTRAVHHGNTYLNFSVSIVYPSKIGKRPHAWRVR